MPLIFTNPALLLGALAGAVPVIIHFLSRRRVQRRQFSDLRFLDEVQARQARSLGIRRWLLLLLRVLAIVLIALAAAGPRWGGLMAAGGGARSVLFVIDTSASMSTQTGQGTRLDEALQAAEGMIASLPENTTVQIITAGAATEPLFGDWLPAGAGSARGLDLVSATDGGFDPAAVLREAARQTARAPAPQVEMVWVGDLQDIPDEPQNAPAARALLGSGTVRHLVRPVGAAVPGGGVLNVALPGRAVHPGENVAVTALVTSRFPDEVFTLELDGRTVAQTVVPAAAATPVDVVFALAAPPAGLHRGQVRRDSDVFPADDQRPFVLQVPEALDVLLVHGQDRAVDPAAGRGGWRFLAEALAPGGAPGLFRVRSLDSADLTTGDLAACRVALFVDPDPLGRRATESLLAWLRAGGAAVFLVGEPALAGYLGGNLLPAIGLPGEALYAGGGEGQAERQRPRIIDPGHPVFAGLEAEALATFEDVIWRRWFRLQEGPGRVLLALTDASPLLIETDLEQGRAVVLPFDLVPAAGGLATSPMALPFFQRLVSWLAGAAGDGAAVNLEVGAQARVTPPVAGTAGSLLERTEDLLILDDRGAVLRAADLVWSGGRPQLAGDPTRRAGFLTFTAGGDTVGVVAAGVPAAESILGLMTIDRWRARLQGWGLELAADLSAPGGQDLAGLLAGRELAPWFFLGAVLLLLLELWLGRAASGARSLSG